eukprot:534777-Pleurochrysis_carterae.AAC.2
MSLPVVSTCSDFVDQHSTVPWRSSYFPPCFTNADAGTLGTRSVKQGPPVTQSWGHLRQGRRPLRYSAPPRTHTDRSGSTTVMHVAACAA